MAYHSAGTVVLAAVPFGSFSQLVPCTSQPLIGQAGLAPWCLGTRPPGPIHAPPVFPISPVLMFLVPPVDD